MAEVMVEEVMVVGVMVEDKSKILTFEDIGYQDSDHDLIRR